MQLKLNVYKDDNFTEVKKTYEKDSLRIPYKVAMHVAKMLDQVSDFTDEKQVLKIIASSGEYLTKIIKATFGVSESELEYVDILEMYDVAMEIYQYVLGKFKSLTGGQGPNMETAGKN